MAHKYSKNFERNLMKSKIAHKAIDPIVNKVIKYYNFSKYNDMVDKLTSEAIRKGLPYDLSRFELTCEGLCQGIWKDESLIQFVEAGLNEKRYEDVTVLIDREIDING